MANRSEEQGGVADVRQRLNEALRDCEELLVRARKVLRQSGQDNDR